MKTSTVPEDDDSESMLQSEEMIKFLQDHGIHVVIISAEDVKKETPFDRMGPEAN